MDFSQSQLGNRPNYHIWTDSITTLLRSHYLYIYLEKPLLSESDDNYDLVCLKQDDAIVEESITHVVNEILLNLITICETFLIFLLSQYSV